MKIVATTLVGVGRHDEAPEAFTSAWPISSAHIMIDTSPPETEPLAADLPCLVTIVRWPWRDDFGAAVNAALDFAESNGATWSMRVDSDERVVCPDPVALRSYLAALAPDVVVVLAHSEGGTHTRERLFRHPNPGRFVGRTHEQFRARAGGTHAIAPRELIYWSELPKSPQQLEAKNGRDVTMLRADLADDPTNAGAWFYLGSTLQAMGRHEEAIGAWREQLRLDSGEGGAWGAFKAAESNLELGRWDRVIDCCLAGMARDAGIAELPWLAAIASLRIGRWEQARSWALLAKVHGVGSDAEKRRTGFRVPWGLTVGPDEVLDFVRERLVWPRGYAGTIEDIEYMAARGDGAIEIVRAEDRERLAAIHADIRKHIP